MYGRKYMGIVRSAFVIDEAGKLTGVYYKISPKDTVPKVTALVPGGLRLGVLAWCHGRAGGGTDDADLSRSSDVESWHRLRCCPATSRRSQV